MGASPEDSHKPELSGDSLPPAPRSEIEPTLTPSNRANLPSVHISSTQLLLMHAAELPMAELKYAKNALAGLVHHSLFLMAQQGALPPITVQGGAAPGTLSNSLVRNREAGRYLAGEISVSSSLAQLAFTGFSNSEVHFHNPVTGRMFNHFTGEWQKIKNLPSGLIIGFNGTLRHDGESALHVYTSERTGEYRDESIFVPRPNADNFVDRWRSAQILATVAALHYLGRWVDEHSGEKTFQNLLVGDLRRPEFQILQPERHPDIRAVKNLNDALFQRTLLCLRAVQHGGISLGESFTGGAIASLFHSMPQVGRHINTSVVWYAREFKTAFGVEDEKLRPRNIAEIETVVDAAKGLHASLPQRRTSTAIATSGWANYHAKGESDFFSVAAHSKFAEHDARYAYRVSVDSTRDEPLSTHRKELTRQLGVTAALGAMALSLLDLYPQLQRHLKPVSNAAEEMLKRFARFELRQGMD